ncbi:hypothetical protein JX266_006472 [Neoarthrinium moseri]|nr:hypothetical protein JX266_006472 [Neoarthrinium moseri]
MATKSTYLKDMPDDLPTRRVMFTPTLGCQFLAGVAHQERFLLGAARDEAGAASDTLTNLEMATELALRAFGRRDTEAPEIQEAKDYVKLLMSCSGLPAGQFGHALIALGCDRAMVQETVEGRGSCAAACTLLLTVSISQAFQDGLRVLEVDMVQTMFPLETEHVALQNRVQDEARQHQDWKRRRAELRRVRYGIRRAFLPPTMATQLGEWKKLATWRARELDCGLPSGGIQWKTKEEVAARITIAEWGLIPQATGPNHVLLSYLKSAEPHQWQAYLEANVTASCIALGQLRKNPPQLERISLDWKGRLVAIKDADPDLSWEQIKHRLQQEFGAALPDKTVVQLRLTHWNIKRHDKAQASNNDGTVPVPRSDAKNRTVLSQRDPLLSEWEHVDNERDTSDGEDATMAGA